MLQNIQTNERPSEPDLCFFLMKTRFSFYEKRVFWSIQALGVAESDSAQKTCTNSLDESSVALNGVEI